MCAAPLLCVHAQDAFANPLRFTEVPANGRVAR